MPDNKLKQFHDSIKGNPNISGVPEDFSRFESALKNPSTSKAFFDAISKNEAIGGLPKDYNTFASSLGIVEKKNPNVPTASSGMGVLLAGKGKAQQSVSEQIVSNLPKTTTAKPKEPEEDGKYWERTKSTLSTLGKSVVDGVFATSAKQIAIVSKTIDDEVREMVGMKPLSKPIEQYQTYQWGKSIESATDKTFQPNPEFKGEIQEQVAQTAGDLLGLVATAIITKNPSSAIAKMGTKGIVKGLANSATRREITRQIAKESVKMLAKPTTFVAAAQTGTRNYDEAKSKGATDDQANAMFWSTAITGGIVNNLPVGSLLNRFDKASGGKMKDMVVGGVVGGVEEAVTEGIEQISTNFAAKNIYDETRTLFEGLGESVAMGGGIGFVLNAMGVKLGSIRNKYKGNPEKLAEIDKSIDYIKDIAEKEGQSSAIKLSKEEENQIDRYSEVINNPQSSPEEIDIANEKIQEITGQKIIDAESSTRFTSNLSEDTQVELKLIDSEIERLREAAAKSDVVDIRDQLELDINKLNAEKDKIINQSNEPQGSRIETPISDSLNSVENTTEALGKKDTQFLKKQLGIEANWDMVGEGDVLAGNDPVLAYTKRKLPDWHKESQRGNIDANSKITYDIQRQPATRSITLPSGYVIDGSPELVNKDVAYAKDENGVIIGMIELETFKDGKNGIRHIAVAPEFRGKGVSDKLIEILKENNPQLDLSKTKLRSKGFEKAFGNKVISEAYHKAKADDSNPELVNAVEKLLGGTQRTGEGVVTENDKAIADALATPENTAKALESASTFQPKRIEELTAPKIGYSATLFDKDGKVVENKIEVLDIDTETNIATIVGAKGREEKVPVARIRKTIEQVSKEFHSGDIEPELLTDIVTKDISDPDVNQQRRMSAQVQSVGNKNIIGSAPEWVQKIYKKYVSSGDRGAVRALETKESILAEKRDRLASVSKRLSGLIGKDTEARKDANTVLSQDYVDDKIDSFTNKKTDEAISVLTGVELDKLREAYANPNTDENKELLKSVNENLKSQTEKGTKKEIEELIYNEVIKDKEAVRDLSVKWMNLGQIGDNKSAEERKIAREDVEGKLLALHNGERIIETLKEAKINTILAKRNLQKSKLGRELLTTVNEARDMIDEFSKWVENNVAALKIRDKDIGESIINNSGLYIKKTYDYWTDKDFTLDEKAGKQAVNSIKTTLLPQRLSALAATKKFESATEEKRADMVQAVVDKAEKDASMIFAKYIAEISAKKEFKPSHIYPNATKVQSKNTWEREFINEEFGKILGRSEDAIDRLHASVVSQAQIQSAAEMGMILEQLSGEQFYDSKESAIDSLMKDGMTEIEAGEVVGKNFKEVNDKYSPLDGKLIPVDIYDTVYEQLNASHNALWDALKAATVLWRMTKTVFNPAGHITNAMGGHISIAEQGHLIDNKTVDFFLDRFRLTKGSNNISDYAKEIKKKMVDTGLWGTSVSIADINILLKYANDLGSGDKNLSEQALIQIKKTFNERLGGIKRYYSATDDFSKLILFHKKKDIFAKKLYGKPYESLTTKEEAIVDANIAERVKQNMPTGSRLPKFAKAIIGSVVLGDFQGFRFGAFTSFANTLGNAYGDIEKGFKDKSLSLEQKKAYLLDGFKTLSSSMAVFSLDKSMAAVMTGMTASLLGTMAKGLFDNKEDKNGNPIGSRFDFYQNVKNSFYMPEWGFGQNLIVSSDNGKGKLKLLNLSNTFPNDESYKLFGSQENLPALSWDNRSALGSAIVETFGTNAVLNIFTNAIEGKDNWNRPIDNSVLGRLAYVGGEFAIPSLKHINKEAIAFAKDKQGKAPVDYDEIDTRRVTLLNYLHGMLVNSPQLIKRTYTLDIPQQVYFNLGAFYKDNAKKFKSLTESEKYERIKKLEPVRKAFVQLRKYEIFTKGNVNAEKVFNNAFTGLRGKASDEEKTYILTGEKPFNE